ncbi:MAG TPA: ABC transporter ATP-binding protein [Candidatus Dormibacteraeota bacterium]|jgi:peptide/nickel transport system ATP-binding protein/oligopeptide transport system ATP-binding protein
MTAAAPALSPEPTPARAAAETILDVSGLSTSFETRAGRVHAVQDVTFSVAPGEIVGLVGESGSGKTVTSLSLLRLLPATARTTGRVVFEGRDVMKLRGEQLRQLRGGRIAMVFQDPMTSLDPVFTVGSQMVGALRAHQRIPRAEALERSASLLEQVGIPDVATRLSQYPHELSGGMRQRVLIAMALSNDPGLLIADEPTTALDVTIQAQILRLLKDINQRTGMAIILVTHDLGVIAGLCDRVFVMYGGRLVESAPAHDLFHGPEHPYTAGLLDSVVRLDQDRNRRLSVIDGSPPVLIDPEPCCPFNPRCPYAVERCREAVPALTPRAPGHDAACFRTEAAHEPLR